MDDTNFDFLCNGLSADEAKHMRKILKEWCNGDENSFPVQLALLTKAQWRAAAQMPFLLQRNIAAFETKLADQQKQIAALMRSLSSAGDAKTKAFEDTVATHTDAMKEVASKNCDHLDETEKFAREIRKQMEYGLRESDRITKAFIDERHRLEEAQHRYDRSMEWRETAQQLLAMILAVGFGFFLAWYHFVCPN
jgi:hypothetical protein